MAEIVLKKGSVFSTSRPGFPPNSLGGLLMKEIDAVKSTTKQRHLMKVVKELDKKALEIDEERLIIVKAGSKKDEKGVALENKDGNFELIDEKVTNKDVKVLFEEDVTVVLEDKTKAILIETLTTLPVPPGAFYVSAFDDVCSSLGIEPQDPPEEPKIPANA